MPAAHPHRPRHTAPVSLSVDELLGRSAIRPVLLLIAPEGAAGRDRLPELARRLRAILGPCDFAVIDPDRDPRRDAAAFLGMAEGKGLSVPPYAGWSLLLLRGRMVAALLHGAMEEADILHTFRRIARVERGTRPSQQRALRDARRGAMRRRWPLRVAAGALLLLVAAIPTVLWRLTVTPPPEPPQVFRVRTAQLIPIPPSPPPAGVMPHSPLLGEEPVASAPAPAQTVPAAEPADLGGEGGDGPELTVAALPSTTIAPAAIPPAATPPDAVAALPPPAPEPATDSAPSPPEVTASTSEPRQPALRAKPTTLVLVGDVFLGTHHPDGGAPNPRLAAGADADAVLSSDLLRLLRSADATFGNLEMALSDERTPNLKNCAGDACFVFVGPTDYARLLSEAGFDFLSLANNHANDAGAAGRRASLAALNANGIAAAGLDPAESRLRNADTTIGLLADGRRIGFAAFAPNVGTVSLHDLKGVAARVRMLAARTEFVVVSVHGGAEGAGHARVPHGPETYRGEARGDLRAFARAAIDAGADLVFGHGPHVARAIERYRGRPIAYSLGNFWAYKGMSRRGATAVAPVLRVTLAGDASPKVEVWSVRQGPHGVPELDPAQTALALVRGLTAEDFPEALATIAGPDPAHARALLAALTPPAVPSAPRH